MAAAAMGLAGLRPQIVVACSGRPNMFLPVDLIPVALILFNVLVCVTVYHGTPSAQL